MLGGSLSYLLLSLSSSLGDQDSVGCVDAEKQPNHFRFRCARFDLFEQIVLLFVAEAPLQTGRSFLVEQGLHLFGRLVVFSPSLSYKIVDDAFPGSESAILIGGVDGVCSQVRACPKKKLML